MTATTTQTNWARWLGECLINFVDESYIQDVLVKNGFDEKQVVEMIAQAGDDPFVQAGRSMSVRYRRLEWQMRIYEQNYSQSQYFRTIERRDKIPFSEFLERHWVVNRPVILTGMLDNWKARTAWTPEYLKAQFGHFTVEFQEYQFKESGELFFGRNTLGFDAFVDKVETAPENNQFYLTAYNSPQHFEFIQALMADIELFPDYLVPPTEDNQVSMWYGPAGTLTGLHIDKISGLLCQVQGRKLVRMIPPHHLPHMYYNSDFFTDINPEDVDLNRFPLFKYAQQSMMEFTLEPGEVLFVPIGWWHQVRALEKSISLSFTNFAIHNDYPTFTDLYGKLYPYL